MKTFIPLAIAALLASLFFAALFYSESSAQGISTQVTESNIVAR